jgi:hypothetical protein
MITATVVKHWGIWPVTRRRYLLALGLQVLSVAGLFAVWRILPHPFPPLAPGDGWLSVLLIQGVVANTDWFLLAFTLYTGADAVVMLCRFASKGRRDAEPLNGLRSQ